MPVAFLTVRYADGGEEELPLRFGNNVIGKKGGPADLQIAAQSLSRCETLRALDREHESEFEGFDFFLFAMDLRTWGLSSEARVHVPAVHL